MCKKVVFCVASQYAVMPFLRLLILQFYFLFCYFIAVAAGDAVDYHYYVAANDYKDDDDVVGVNAGGYCLFVTLPVC